MSHNPQYLYDYLVFIGRFQPFHLGHKAVVDRALELSRQVIILVGSSDRTRSYRNPFTFEERKEMILGDFLLHQDRLIIKPINDFPYNDDQWLEYVHKTVSESLPGNSPNNSLHGFNSYKIGLIGHSKDKSSFYLKMFPMWEPVEVPNLSGYNATSIRDSLFNYMTEEYQPVSEFTKNWLKNFLKSDACRQLHDEYEFIEKYKKQWANTPYPVIFSTVDAVVVQSGHLLVVERKAQPGKGLLALPGGFLQQDERILDGTIRELREETKLKVPAPVLKGSIASQRVFDDPHRSSRGRTITHATYFKLTDQVELPKVKGSDDAATAFWMPLGEIDNYQFFEDHYHIIRTFLP